MGKKLFSILVVIGLICFCGSKTNALINVDVQFFSDEVCNVIVSVDKERNIPGLLWIERIYIKDRSQLMALSKINKLKIVTGSNDFYKVVDIMKKIQYLDSRKDAILSGQIRFVEQEYNQLHSSMETKKRALSKILTDYIGFEQVFLFA